MSLLGEIIEWTARVAFELAHLIDWWGEYPRGRVDRTPDGIYVVTDFFCVLGIAVVPQSSWLRADECGELHTYDSQLPTNTRSVLAAYARSGTIAGAVLALISAGTLFGARAPSLGLLALGVAGALSLLAVGAFFLFRHAPPARAAELLSLARRKSTPGTGIGFQVSAPAGRRARR